MPDHGRVQYVSAAGPGDSVGCGDMTLSLHFHLSDLLTVPVRSPSGIGPSSAVLSCSHGAQGLAGKWEENPARAETLPMRLLLRYGCQELA